MQQILELRRRRNSVLSILLTAATPERGPGRLRINGLPRRNIPAEALGLITMISEYLQVFNIDLTAKFSTVMLDSHATGQATVEVELRPGALLGWDLPHLERNILKHFPSCQ